MAHYNITYSCGHSARIQLFGKESERQRKIEYFERYGLCTECYRAKKASEPCVVDIKYEPCKQKDENGEPYICIWFTGNTYPLKDNLKAAGYMWRSRYWMDTDFSRYPLSFLSCNGYEKFWAKKVKCCDFVEEVQKAAKIGNTIFDKDDIDIENYEN